jgi:hypothetical protein
MKKAILYVSALIIGSSAAFAQDADRSTGQKTDIEEDDPATLDKQ